MARQKAEGRYDHILNSALTLFGKYGFAKTTIQDVAKEARVASGTIYLYFKNKDEILKACAQRFHKTHLEYTQNLLKLDIPPSDKLRDYLTNRYDLWKQETSAALAGSDLAQAMLNLTPETHLAEQKLWRSTLRSVLAEGEERKIYHFSSLAKELKIFLHCLMGFFPLPGAQAFLTPTKKDLLDALEWFDKKWRTRS